MNDDKPWYRQSWPWLLIALPASSVAMGMVMLFTAVHGADPLVEDDWYKQGLAVNRDHQRDDAARRIGIEATLLADAGGLTLQVTASHGSLPDRVQLHLQHPTRGDADIDRVLLLENGTGKTGPLSLPAADHWYVVLESLPGTQPAWRINGTWASGDHRARIVPDDTP